MPNILISLFIGFGVFYILHVLIWRLKPSNAPRIFLLAILMAVGLVVSLVVSYLRGQTSHEDLFSIVAISIFIYIGYGYVYSAMCRSVSLTLLDFLLQSPGETVPLQEMMRHYLASDRFEDRLRVMESVKLIEIHERSVILTPRGKLASKTVERISTLLCGGLEG